MRSECGEKFLLYLMSYVVGGYLFAVQTYVVTNLRTLYAVLFVLDP
jgi:hypothetical protein